MYTGRAPVSIMPCSIDLWQLRSTTITSSVFMQACMMLRLLPEVPTMPE